ncbi:hypothetical protein [uncultured Legionella sp.]|uniref:hypothetical protein n=1 Tax=uncultured Legionella sp. TaxID=210934 RepID=UPI00262A668C|nr:hypothetical protein [uncultured Legionella sp.]
MTDLQPMSVNSAVEPMGTGPEFDRYEHKAEAYNERITGSSNTLNASQILQQAAQVLAENPQLAMAL